jgi:AraC family transcriptional activator of tynA and feaB
MNVPHTPLLKRTQEDAGVRRWSTSEVPHLNRLEYFSAAISEAVMPISVDNADPVSFHASVSVAQLGSIGVCKMGGTAHSSHRGPTELARSDEHRFSLSMMLDCDWTAEARGRMQLMPRDILLCDSEQPVRADVRHRFTALCVVVEEDWLRRWLPNPNVLVARRIAGQSPWGHALSSYLAALSPELVAAPPLPVSVLADQVGSLLALTAMGLRQQAAPECTPAVQSLFARILSDIEQRCPEHELLASHLATALDISLRTLHRVLAANGRTFGAILIDARAKTAERMLRSPLFNRLTSAEIGRRAGFSSASHFARVMRRRTGYSPQQWRRQDA